MRDCWIAPSILSADFARLGAEVDAVVAAGADLIPFDVIPCHPDGGFLQFIEDTLAAGHTVRAVRSTHTT